MRDACSACGCRSAHDCRQRSRLRLRGSFLSHCVSSFSFPLHSLRLLSLSVFCSGSWDAALHAAGAVCAAIDRVVAGEVRNAFCPVRPPGHHAGPRGVVTCENDKDGSHGFCLLNNVALGAAYARAHYGRAAASYGAAARAGAHAAAPALAAAYASTAPGQGSLVPAPPASAAAEGSASAAAAAAAVSAPSGAASASRSSSSSSASTSTSSPIRRIAIFDFDVHHGNGTEAIVRSLYPTEIVETVPLHFGNGAFSTMVYRPWLDQEDGNDVLFVSSHGYGKRDPTAAADAPFVGWFYPGSGKSEGWDEAALTELRRSARRSAPSSSSSSSASTGAAATPAPPAATPSAAAPPVDTAHGSGSSASASAGAAGGAGQPQAQTHPAQTPHFAPAALSLQPMPVPEPLLESRLHAPHIINVAVPHGQTPRTWRRIMTADVLPRIAAFKPDLILISAGFDAHHKDGINLGYVGLREDDYEWITTQLIKVANACCGGRIVSVLEGGYRIQGRIVSAFGRSVAAHVRALASGYSGVWDSGRERVSRDCYCFWCCAAAMPC